MSSSYKIVFHFFSCFSLAAGALAQQAGQTVPLAAQPLRPDVPRNYVLHAEDEITIHSLEVKELADKPFRLDQNGEINFPLLGRVHLGGESTRAAEADIAERLKKYYHDPDVALNITAFHEEPVSVIGAVGIPGVHAIHGRATLLDVLSAAGGVRGDAGAVVNISRDSSSNGPIPYPTAHAAGAHTSLVEIDLKSLMSGANSSENIGIEAHDVISVPPAEVVYVIGNVKRAGGFPLGGKPDLTVLQAVSLAEGLDQRASAKGARILRRESTEAPDAARTQIPVDISAILKGKAPDILMRPNDILYVPSSTSKAVTQRTIEAAIAVTTGMLILGR